MVPGGLEGSGAEVEYLVCICLMTFIGTILNTQLQLLYRRKSSDRNVYMMMMMSSASEDCLGQIHAADLSV